MPAEDTQWTVMAYLAGDNNLNEEMVMTLQQMLEFGVWPRVKILAQLDPSALGLPTQRYVFDPDGKDVDKLRCLDTYQVDFDGDWEGNTGNPTALSGFAKWAIDGHVSDHYYALILSGHGSGSTEDFLMKDENPVDSLSVPELTEALSEVKAKLGGTRKIDLLGMDCCFMSMVEVCYQVRNFVKHIVGAESLVPDFGWPFSRILRRAEQLRLHKIAAGAQGIVKPAELGEIMVEQFIDFYSDYDHTAGRSADLAWIKLKRMQALKDAIDSLGQALRESLEEDADSEPELKHRLCLEQIVLAHWEAQTYKSDQFVDIRDFCLNTRARFVELVERMEILEIEPASLAEIAGTATAITEACDAVISAFEKCVQLSGCSGFAYQHSFGLSVYFPWAYVSDTYANLEFAQDDANNEGEWLQFLRRYIDRTCRGMRTEGSVEMEEVQRDQEVTSRAWLEAAMEDLVRGWSEARKEAVAAGQLTSAIGSSSLGDGDVAANSRYNRSRYNRSRYNRSRYNRSRWPGDREKSVKNFQPITGTAYWPAKPVVLEDLDPD